MVVVPCKGAEEDLEGNLRAVFRQDYDDYEVVLVVEGSTTRPARRSAASWPRTRSVPSRLLMAGRAPRRGAEGPQPPRRHGPHPGPHRLPGLPRLRQPAAAGSGSAPPWPGWIGRARRQPPVTAGSCPSGPRRPIPVDERQRDDRGAGGPLDATSWCGAGPGPSAATRSTASASTGPGKGRSATTWWPAACSSRPGLRMRFEPGCVVASPLDRSPAEAFSFLRRQYLIGRHYATAWWWFAVASTTLRNVAWLASAGGCWREA